MDVLLHVANTLTLLSFLVRDILKLRALSIVAGALLTVLCLTTAPVGWDSFAWHMVFGLINVVQVLRLLHERRPVRLSAEEHELHQRAFRPLAAREFAKLLRVTRFIDAVAGERVIEAGRAPGRLCVVLRGALEVRVADAAVATLGPGQFVGEMAFVTGETPKADVVAGEDTRLAALESAGLRALLEHDHELRAAIQGILGADLAGKLRLGARLERAGAPPPNASQPPQA